MIKLQVSMSLDSWSRNKGFKNSLKKKKNQVSCSPGSILDLGTEIPHHAAAHLREKQTNKKHKQKPK